MRVSAIILAICVAASVGAQGPVAPTRRLANGVVELRHDQTALDRAPKWSVDPKPLMRAGGANDPDHDLTNVQSVALMPDGSLVTLAGIGSRLFWFPASGRGARELSRLGEGPGELMAPDRIVLVGDTLLVADGGNNRVNRILPSKGFVATVPWPTGASRNATPVGALRDGRIVLASSGRWVNSTADSLFRSKAQVALANQRFASVATVAELSDMDMVRIGTRYRGRRGTQTMPLAFSRYSQIAAWDTVIATSGADGYRVDLRNASGKVISSIVVDRRRRPVTKAMRDSVVAEQMRRLSGPATERMVDPNESRRIQQVRPAADSLPSFGGWFVSPNRTLWIVDYIAPGDVSRTATAFRQDGAIIARLFWKGTGIPMAFGDDRVAMRELDDDGVVSLKVYRITR